MDVDDRIQMAQLELGIDESKLSELKAERLRDYPSLHLEEAIILADIYAMLAGTQAMLAELLRRADASK